MFFSKTIKQVKRIREVGHVLLRHGFEEVVTSTALGKLVPQKTRLSWLRGEKLVFEYSRWERIRMVVEDLGPTFIKLAQVVSNRPDLLPEPLIKEFQKLQNDVPPFPFSEVQGIIEQETQKKLEETFEYFAPETIGSASLGQVHKATLLGGQEVAVKVQRPNARKKVETDLSLVRELVILMEGYLRKIGVINPLDIVDAFESTLQKELNYTIEARNIDQFRNFYKDSTDFYVPAVYKKVSTERILVLEFVSGCMITDLKQLKDWGLDPKQIVEKGLDIYLTQIFKYGYFHADPHPGNVLVRKDGVILLIDFGMVGRLMKKDKYAFAGVVISMAQQDARGMAINFKRLSIDSDIEDMRRFEYALNELIEEFASLDVDDMNMADLVASLQKIIFDYQLRVPRGVFLILRALAILEGIGKTIHPQFNTFEFLKPYGKDLVQEQYSWENISTEIANVGVQLLGFVSSFPFQMRTIFSKLRKGKITFIVENRGYEPLTKTFNRATNRAILGFIIGTLLLASAITMTAYDDLSRFPLGIPYLSAAGYTLAAILAFVLMISVWRSNK